MISEVKSINIADFDYPLPDDKIARHPLASRDACKLLAFDGANLKHLSFSSLPNLIPSDSLLIRNDTKVINARIKFQKPSGAQIEVFLLEPISPEDYALMFQACGSCKWSCLVGNLKRWKSGPLCKDIIIDGAHLKLTAILGEAREGNAHEIEFSWDNEDVTFASVVDAAGYIPIPPYLKRDSEASDADDYQTVYARVKGSVAAPTAGLHFTPALLDNIRHKGVDVESVTLHVGAGTFQPVKSDNIGGHPMHTEVFGISLRLLEKIIVALEQHRPVIAVGTTSVRTLESLPYLGKHVHESGMPTPVTQWEAYDEPKNQGRSETLQWLSALKDYMIKENLSELTAETSIMIAPGFSWRIVNGMVTNFHQPQSTLLLLVSSFLGLNANGAPIWKELYNSALTNNYRFLSYGDACFFYHGE